jgi:hypothetical protein
VTSYPATLLVSYQTYRQLSGWILPPLVIHALSGHTATYGETGTPGSLRSPGLRILLRRDLPRRGRRVDEVGGELRVARLGIRDRLLLSGP